MGSTTHGQGRSSSSFLIEDILFPRRHVGKTSDESEKPSTSLSSLNSCESEGTKLPEVQDVVGSVVGAPGFSQASAAALSHLNNYNSLAAYFSSHAAAAAAMASSSSMASSSTSSGFLHQSGAHATIPPPFFLPSGTQIINVNSCGFKCLTPFSYS